MREASVNFSFLSPAPEDVSNGTMEGISDPQPSQENLRQHLEDQSSLNISHNEDVSRDITEPSLVLLEDKDTAYEETESPGLDSDDDTATILTYNSESSASVPLRLNKEAQNQTDKIVIMTEFDLWIEHSDWFKANKHHVKPAVRQHKVQYLDGEIELVSEFCNRQLGRGVSKCDLKNLWNNNHSEDQVLLQEYRCLQEKVARNRFDWFWQTCDNLKQHFDESNLPFDQPLAVGFDRREPCDSPNFNGCICQEPDSHYAPEDEWITNYLQLET